MRQLDDEDDDDIAKLKAESWQLECLAMNPRYVSWGPYEDYMCREKDGSWEGRIIIERWSPLEGEKRGPEDMPSAFFNITLDALNEVVHFYFQVTRDSERCERCAGSGLNPATKKLNDDYYAHERTEHPRTGARRMPDFLGGGWLTIDREAAWIDKITQDEVDALVKANRLYDFTHVHTPEKGWQPKDPPYRPTAAEVNAAQREATSGIPYEQRQYKGYTGHDAINQYILLETRAKRLGVYGHCAHCEDGFVYTAPKAKLGLVLWLLHPRKGCSRGVHVEEILQSDLPAVYRFLRGAAARNAERFAKIPDEKPASYIVKFPDASARDAFVAALGQDSTFAPLVAYGLKLHVATVLPDVIVHGVPSSLVPRLTALAGEHARVIPDIKQDPMLGGAL